MRPGEKHKFFASPDPSKRTQSYLHALTIFIEIQLVEVKDMHAKMVEMSQDEKAVTSRNGTVIKGVVHLVLSI